MKIIILHHHLRGGGVTRIIELQIKSLLSIGYKSDNIQVLTGDKSNFKNINRIKITEISELDYLEQGNYPKNIIDEKLELIILNIKNNLTKNDILHIHNWGLGKNPILTFAIYKLLYSDYKIFNHCHDFSEDRPRNTLFLKSIVTDIYKKKLSEILYPKNSNIFYGTINSFDNSRVKNEKINPKNLFYLPNPVDENEFNNIRKNKISITKKIRKKLNINSEKKLITYPVRIIKRKNIEELILLSVLFKKDITFAITLAPKNPIEIEYYSYWKEFAIKQKLPILFDTVKNIDYRELIAASDLCITTSVREGFGMAFIEPWLVDTPVTGRDLPNVTSDFNKIGLRFPTIYKSININNSDFSKFNREDTTNIILKFIENPNLFNSIIRNIKEIKQIFNIPTQDIISKNRAIIIDNYSIENYGKKLDKIYKKLSKQTY